MPSPQSPSSWCFNGKNSPYLPDVSLFVLWYLPCYWTFCRHHSHLISSKVSAAYHGSLAGASKREFLGKNCLVAPPIPPSSLYFVSGPSASRLTFHALAKVGSSKSLWILLHFFSLLVYLFCCPTICHSLGRGPLQLLFVRPKRTAPPSLQLAESYVYLSFASWLRCLLCYWAFDRHQSHPISSHFFEGKHCLPRKFSRHIQKRMLQNPGASTMTCRGSKKTSADNKNMFLPCLIVQPWNMFLILLNLFD